MSLPELRESPATWSEWKTWADELVATHDPEQVAQSLADLGEQMAALREGMFAEARIIAAQTLSLSPRALGKNRRRIVTTQVQRMCRVALAQEPPRGAARRGRAAIDELLYHVTEGGE